MADETDVAPVVANPARGRAFLWLGISAALGGLVAYMIALALLHQTHTPWYAPALATAGALMILLSLLCRATTARFIVFLLFSGLAGLEWWFISYTENKPYTGPVEAGKPFPAFAAERANGTPFTRADLVGEQDTVLVFFSGHW